MNRKKRNMWIALSTSLALVSFVMTLFIWGGISPQEITGAFYRIDYVNASEVRMSQSSFDLLSSRYVGDQKEFIYCLYGDSFPGDDKPHYLIEEMKETRYVSDDDSVTYVPCKKSSDYLGTIHSHPQPSSPRYVAVCDLSKQDVFTFGGDDSLLTGVICGKDKIAFYEVDDLNNPIAYSIVG